MEAYRNRALAESVRERLMEDRRVSGQPFNVTASGGYIQLIGRVENEEQKHIAVELAEGVVGVRGVEDHLDVMSPTES